MVRELNFGSPTRVFIRDLLIQNRGYILGALTLAGANRAAALFLPVSTRYLVDTILTQHRGELLSTFLAAVAAATMVQAGTAWGLNSLVARRSHAIVGELQSRVVRHVLRLPLVFHDNNASGTAATRIASDTDAVRHLLGFPAIDFTCALITGLISAIVLWQVSPALAEIGAAMLAVAIAGFAFCVRISRAYVRQRAAIMAETTGRLTETFAAVRMVKAFAIENREETAYRANIHRFLANVDKSTRLSSAVAFARVVIGGAGGLLLTWAGAHEIMHGRLTIGGLMVAVVLWATLASALLEGGAAAISITESLAGIDRLRELMAHAREDDVPARAVTFNIGQGRVVFENVSFTYGGRTPVLNKVSFELAPGSVTAIVGASGAGKSTIGAIASGLYTPTCGRVLVDGYDLRTVKLSTYRRQIGVVPQDVTLMSGTIRDNILLARTGVTDIEFRVACRSAGVAEFVERFPSGYDTGIGERGVQLSGGQRQRIAIARALLADPRILILDEPTASLDRESAELVSDAIAKSASGRTVIVIAHSVHVVHRADQVLLLENGTVIARGSPSELQLGAGPWSARNPGKGRFFASPFQLAP